MNDLLLLTHRIPYPPNKGDKVRSYHLLRYLADKYRVYLGTFVDDPRDWRHAETVTGFCVDAHFEPLPQVRNKLLSLSALWSGEPLTVRYFRSRRLQEWVRQVLGKGSVERIVIFSSSMAQYIGDACGRAIMDFIDVDSYKWQQYAEKSSGPMRWIYQREGRELLKHEETIAERFDASVFVSEQEAQLFRRFAPQCSTRVLHINNGVDADYFCPDRPYHNPYDQGDKVLVFTGAMDYPANIDGAVWFGQEVFPMVRAYEPRSVLCIVGSNPTRRVRSLGKERGVRVVGDVSDIRPYLAHAMAAIAPLRIARGVQNKVLEAMAMGKSVLATPAATEGINVGSQAGVRVMSDANSLAKEAQALVSRSFVVPNTEGRRHVLEHHDWERNLARFVEILENGPKTAKKAQTSEAARA